MKQDCREGMNNLIKQGYSKYFDFIELDPPYNIGKDKWDKFKSHEEYLEFIKEVMELSNQLLSNNGTLFLWHNDINIIFDFMNVCKNTNDLKLVQMITWNKHFKYNVNGELNKQYEFLNGYIQVSQNRSYMLMCEYIMYFIKEENKKNPFSTIIKQKMKELHLKQKDVANLQLSKNGNCTGWVSNKIKGEQLPTPRQWMLMCNLFNIPNEYDKLRYTYNSNKNTDRHSVWQYPMSKETKHKTEKPLQLYYDMFEVHTKKDSKCLFPFVGSGNNIISLLELNKYDDGERKYIGYETDDKWFDLINKRIEDSI